jgi:hypothetical protein
MDMRSDRSHEMPADAGRAEADRQQPLLQRAGAKGREPIADLSEFLTRRQHARGGLYLPLVRIDRGD